MAICPIWLTECDDICRSKGDFRVTNAPECDCPRAGGKFQCHVTRFKSLVKNLSDNQRIILSGWIAHKNFSGVTPFIDEKDLKKIISSPMPSTPARLEMALEWLIKNSNGRIGIGPFQLKNDEESNSKCYRFAAFAYSYPVDWMGILKLLEGDGLVYIPRVTRVPAPDPHYSVRVTSKGFSHAMKESIDSSNAFVAMWFDLSMKKVYDKAIDPGIRDAGYEPIRVDRVPHNHKSDDEIIAQIRRARFVVADFTSSDKDKPRGGVYYEAGFAYGLGREVIYTCRADFIDELHFDTRQFNHIKWELGKLDEFREELRLRIERTIGRGPKEETEDA